MVSTDTLQIQSDQVIERFSTETRKSTTKVIILANQSRRKQCNEPISAKRGKTRATHGWISSCLLLVEKVARVLLTNHRLK